MATTQDALYRFIGMWGSAFRAGVQLGEVVEVTAAIDVARIDVPLVGQTKVGYKHGRETREGTMRIQKMHSNWETEFWTFLENRRKGVGTLHQFDLKLQVADPDAYGVEAWQLHGCQIWRLPLGFSITDDVIERELPFTWEAEEPVAAFTVDENGVKTDFSVNG